MNDPGYCKACDVYTENGGMRCFLCGGHVEPVPPLTVLMMALKAQGIKASVACSDNNIIDVHEPWQGQLHLNLSGGE